MKNGKRLCSKRISTAISVSMPLLILVNFIVVTVFVIDKLKGEDTYKGQSVTIVYIPEAFILIDLLLITAAVARVWHLLRNDKQVSVN